MGGGDCPLGLPGERVTHTQVRRPKEQVLLHRRDGIRGQAGPSGGDQDGVAAAGPGPRPQGETTLPGLEWGGLTSFRAQDRPRAQHHLGGQERRPRSRDRDLVLSLCWAVPQERRLPSWNRDPGPLAGIHRGPLGPA